MGPGALAEHFVALQARLVGLAEGVAGPPHADVLHQAQVAQLMANQGLGEDVGSLLIVGLDAPSEAGGEWCGYRLTCGADIILLEP